MGRPAYRCLMETNVDRSMAHGDRVTAARDLDTTQGLHIAQGAEGTVAEDRGSRLVVFFDAHDAAVDLTEPDLRVP
jgi:hypothetical protein